MSKRDVAGKLSAPLIAAGASLAARYVAKKGPEFAENTLLPWLREVGQSAGGVAEKLPEKARSAASSGGDLAEQLSERARDMTDRESGEGAQSRSGGSLSRDELSQRSDERAKRRAQRRNATKKK